MFKREFDAIWAAHAAHHPEVLTPERRAELYQTMFHQRPLKPQTELIGTCELELDQKRAPLWHPPSQRFRMFQQVNDLRLLDQAGFERALTNAERSTLVAALDKQGDLQWKQVRKLLRLLKGVQFNREERGGDPKLVGNRTAAKLSKVFLHRWEFGWASKSRGEVQVDHIIPFSRSLDDSFLNTALCFVDENRRKGDRTSGECYGQTGDPEWERILERVRDFDSPLARETLRRFQMRDDEASKLLSEFSSRQPEDTRYASKLAARYVAWLFGGLVDSNGTLRVFATSGEVTAYLRRLWSLGGLLGSAPDKTREDHRHHAVDAVVIALTGSAWIKRLADAASRARARSVSKRRLPANPNALTNGPGRHRQGL